MWKCKDNKKDIIITSNNLLKKKFKPTISQIFQL